jgi:ferrochelatase
VILAPHRCHASFEKYLDGVEVAKRSAGALALQYDYLGSWFDHPLFIGAQADAVRRALARLRLQDREAVHLVFSAHSIPEAMAARSRYVEEVRMSSERVAQALRLRNWRVAYQSRSGPPEEAWLGPDVLSTIHAIAQDGGRRVLVVPIGFLCDNVEVLYDLDGEARQEAARDEVYYGRADTVLAHPQVTAMFAELIRAACAQPLPAGMTQGGLR